MREYIAGYYTDKGIKKRINQDSLCIRKAVYKGKQLMFAIVCDGMGGLTSGEEASAVVVQVFAEAFVKQIATLAVQDDWEEIKKQWYRYIVELNQKLYEYGTQEGTPMGTALSAILLAGDEYIAVQVGDSRIYRLTDKLQQITEDQSFAAYAVKSGNMTIQQVQQDPRRNMLLECVGASETVHPEFYQGHVGVGDRFILCTDGFWRTEDAMALAQSWEHAMQTEEQIRKNMYVRVQKAMERGETDNITVIYIEQKER